MIATAMTAELFPPQQCFAIRVASANDKSDDVATETTAFTLFKRTCTEFNIPLFRVCELDLAQPNMPEIRDWMQSNLHVENRDRLLLGGGDIENELSVIALLALSMGADVHLLLDTSTSSDARTRKLAEMRLFQAGIVPTSLQQLLYQWSVLSGDEETRQKTTTLLQCYRDGLQFKI